MAAIVYGSDRRDYGSDRRDYGSDRYGSDRRDYGSDRRDYARDRYGSDRRDYGSDRRDYGSDRRDYGSDRRDYGSDRRDYGSDRYGSDRRDYGSDRRDYGSDRRDYGSDRRPVYGSDRRDYGSDPRDSGSDQVVVRDAEYAQYKLKKIFNDNWTTGELEVESLPFKLRYRATQANHGGAAQAPPPQPTKQPRRDGHDQLQMRAPDNHRGLHRFGGGGFSSGPAGACADCVRHDRGSGRAFSSIRRPSA